MLGIYLKYQDYVQRSCTCLPNRWIYSLSVKSIDILKNGGQLSSSYKIVCSRIMFSLKAYNDRQWPSKVRIQWRNIFSPRVLSLVIITKVFHSCYFKMFNLACQYIPGVFKAKEKYWQSISCFDCSITWQLSAADQLITVMAGIYVRTLTKCVSRTLHFKRILNVWTSIERFALVFLDSVLCKQALLEFFEGPPNEGFPTPSFSPACFDEPRSSRIIPCK